MTRISTNSLFEAAATEIGRTLWSVLRVGRIFRGDEIYDGGGKEIDICELGEVHNEPSLVQSTLTLLGGDSVYSTSYESYMKKKRNCRKHSNGSTTILDF